MYNKKEGEDRWNKKKRKREILYEKISYFISPTLNSRQNQKYPL
jgi:hypothetical protein